MDSRIFRQKNVEKVQSPEQLNDYIRVDAPSAWLAVAACVLLLLGFLVWSVFGTVEARSDDGTAEAVHPIAYILN